MKKLVLKIMYGGLGDHLLWTPIPRLAKTKYTYDKVYISTLSEYRNPETKHLVWEYNPYVDGFVDEDAPVPNFNKVQEGKNILDTMVDFVGFPDDGIRYRDPELYYRPKFLEQYKDCILYDPNFISNAGHPSVQAIENYFSKEKIQITQQMTPTLNNRAISNIAYLEIKGLELFCDILYSCKYFYALTSGSATLISALQKPCTVLYANANPMFHHSKRNVYLKLE